MPATLLMGCGASSIEPPSTEMPSLGADAGCADRAQARPLCLRAFEARCASQRRDCEASCEPRLGPETERRVVLPDVEANQCRDGCRQNEQACRQSLLRQCPSLCDPQVGILAEDWHPPRSVW